MLAEIGLTGKVSLPKANVSKDRGGGYRDYYSEASRALVADWYAPEIRHFGYEF